MLAASGATMQCPSWSGSATVKLVSSTVPPHRPTGPGHRVLQRGRSASTGAGTVDGPLAITTMSSGIVAIVTSLSADILAGLVSISMSLKRW